MASENLNADKVIKDTWFLYYCCCGGVGLGPVGDPLIGSQYKELCLAGSCVTADLMGGDAGDGLCSQMAIECCITSHCQFPPMEGAPKVTCFNKPLMASSGSVSRSDPLFDFPAVMANTFWLYYCCCAGCGLSGIKADGRPLYAVRVKELIVRATTDLEEPVKDGIMCASVGTECCIWSQCSMPPVANNPFIACCGWRKNKGSAGDAPAQQEMQ
jgi:hypothetical protein